MNLPSGRRGDAHKVSVHSTDTGNRLKIKHAVVDLAKLELRPIVDGKWLGR